MTSGGGRPESALVGMSPNTLQSQSQAERPSGAAADAAQVVSAPPAQRPRCRCGRTGARPLYRPLYPINTVGDRCYIRSSRCRSPWRGPAGALCTAATVLPDGRPAVAVLGGAGGPGRSAGGHAAAGGSGAAPHRRLPVPPLRLRQLPAPSGVGLRGCAAPRTPSPPCCTRLGLRPLDHVALSPAGRGRLPRLCAMKPVMLLPRGPAASADGVRHCLLAAGTTPQGGSPTGSQGNLSGMDAPRSRIPGGLKTTNPGPPAPRCPAGHARRVSSGPLAAWPFKHLLNARIVTLMVSHHICRSYPGVGGRSGMRPEEVKAALGAKVVPNSGSANSLSAGADAADAALAALKGSPGSSAHDSNTAAAALAGSSASKPASRSIRDCAALIALILCVCPAPPHLQTWKCASTPLRPVATSWEVRSYSALQSIFLVTRGRVTRVDTSAAA